MNHFRVNADKGEEFERAWRERDSFLAGFAGFEQFHLLKGDVDEDGLQHYASHTIWTDEASFRAWVNSEAFRKAHAQGKLSGVLAGPPQFRGWTALDLS
ncbi:MAG: antibiotic biosynthesis monooxygenase [Myxococcota bacterium]